MKESYDVDRMCARVRKGWYPKTLSEWRRFWITYAKMLLVADPRIDDLNANPKNARAREVR